MSTTTKDFISSHGYPAEHHHIVTEDGYVLGVFRIPYSHKLKNQEKIRPIVLIEHGLMGGSDIWFFTGPNHALPYLLVDSGFDVWVGNSRGNTYSRNHISMSTEDPDFWKFSWHEIGYYDIAATIDYSLQVNGQGHQAVHYVGHSQGTTVFFALMSMRPEYNAKIKTAQLMAPVAWMSNMEYKLNDIMAAVKDVNFLAERLPNRELHLVDDPLWDHDDFALNVDLRKVINDPVIEIMKKFESSKN
ncbi:hypothetical protein AWZ03_007856 [Drosophila navojoa]|uniref:Partial AB-hydrolase lipase domain-containing protein n=1 Tax=Drosophila navojoa TaxID=7232 RepID=A0A484BAF7_DRONA|nr:hypothetical protein AWZ03_007856 [Drosophila navojoa]